MKVSVSMITYNHEKFIAQAVESVLMQKANFEYELVIGEDCSTDNTRQILLEYQKKYPDKIRLLLPEKNLGMQKNAINTLQASRGQYIAALEGDDYWTDPLKLQKQVDFLEANPDFAICFHNVAIINEDYPERNRLNNDDLTPEISTLDNLLEGNNYIATCSAVIKTNLIQNLPDWFTSLPFGDYALYLIAARHGKIKYINRDNYNYLYFALKDLNKIDFKLNSDQVPMVYPFYTDNLTIRRILVENRVYTAQYWSNVLNWVEEDNIEYEFTTNIIHLPIDQRYSEDDLKKIVTIIFDQHSR